MQIPVVIKRLPDDQGFEARIGEPFGLQARASGREAAVQRLLTLIQAQMGPDTEYRLLDVMFDRPPNYQTPHYFGKLDQNDPAVVEWKRRVEAYRRNGHFDLADEAAPTGFLPDDDFTRGWAEETAEYRRRKNEEPDPWELTPEGHAALGETVSNDAVQAQPE